MLPSTPLVWVWLHALPRRPLSLTVSLLGCQAIAMANLDCQSLIIKYDCRAWD